MRLITLVRKSAYVGTSQVEIWLAIQGLWPKRFIMVTPRNAVAEIKREMATLSSSGRATHYRGIIVTPEVWDALAEDSEGFHGVMRVSGNEGNRWIRYTFYVVKDSSLAQAQTGITHAFVHHTKDAYEQKFLGKLPEVMARELRKTRIAWCSIEELNPFRGVVAAGDEGSRGYFYEVEYDSVVAVAKATFDARGNIRSALYANFERYNVVHNPPETKWLGKLEFNARGRIAAVETPRHNPFVLNGKPGEDLVGRLLMEKTESSSYRIVGIARDGRGKIHVVPRPQGEFTDKWEFAKVAIHDFLPEEIFVVLWLSSQNDLDKLRALQKKEWWGDWCDYERAGRVQEYSTTGGNRPDGHELSADFINTRAKESSIEIAYVPNDEKDKWKKLHAEYFPPGWKKWPDTKMDRSFAAMAATL